MRPYFHTSTEELELIAARSWNSIRQCNQIIHELEHRPKSGTARTLKYKLGKRVAELRKLAATWAEYPGVGSKREDIEKKFGTGISLAGRVVSFVGDAPYRQTELEDLVFWRSGIVGKDYMWVNDHLLVIGEEFYNESYLLESIDVLKKHEFNFFYLSQQRFLEFVKSDHLYRYYPGDPEIDNHPGLKFLSTRGFEWPEINYEFIYGGGGEGRYDHLTNHPLATQFGYSVRAQVSVSERRFALKAAIRPWPMGLGLQAVAEHIAYLIRDRSTHQPERMAKAIRNWEADYEWLYNEYYKNSIYSFVWPSTDW